MSKQSARPLPRRKQWDRADIYYHASQGHLPIQSIGEIKVCSKELLRARITGVEPDRSKVGMPNDGLIGGQQIADFLNTVFGIAADSSKQVGNFPTDIPADQRPD